MIIGRCLSRELSERYRAAGEVRAALQAVQSDAVVSEASQAVPPRRSFSAAQWGLAAMLVIALLGGIYIITRSTRQAAPAAPPTSGRLALVVSSDRRAFDPALSPDGKMIAYVAQDERGRLDLFVSRVAGGGRVRLTDDDAPKSRPRFSSDGASRSRDDVRTGATPSSV